MDVITHFAASIFLVISSFFTFSHVDVPAEVVVKNRHHSVEQKIVKSDTSLSTSSSSEISTAKVDNTATVTPEVFDGAIEKANDYFDYKQDDGAKKYSFVPSNYSKYKGTIESPTSFPGEVFAVFMPKSNDTLFVVSHVAATAKDFKDWSWEDSFFSFNINNKKVVLLGKRSSPQDYGDTVPRTVAYSDTKVLIKYFPAEAGGPCDSPEISFYEGYAPFNHSRVYLDTLHPEKGVVEFMPSKRLMEIGKKALEDCQSGLSN